MTAQPQPNSFRNGPDERGRFGIFGGRFVAETLMPLILELEAEMRQAASELQFELAARLRDEVSDMKRTLRDIQRHG